MILVTEARGVQRDSQGVLDILALAEQACRVGNQEATGGVTGEKMRRRGRDSRAASRRAAPEMPRHPPARLYEVAARALARAGMWEQAVAVLRKLEVCGSRH